MACILCMPLGTFAQRLRVGERSSGMRISHTYNNVSLSEALLQLNNEQKEYVINFLYNELEDFRVTATIKNKRLSDAIQQMIGFYPVRMTVKPDDHEIYVECTHKTDRHLMGTVIDEQGQPVAYANIAILNPADSTLLSGGVSNESGYFAIPYEQEKVLARISYVGYKTIYKQCNNAELGTIRMQPDTYTLGNVTVRGERPNYQMGGHGLTVNVQGTMLSEAGTANDVIALLPGVDGNNGSFKVIGKGTPLIYVNGRLLHSTAELDRLSSKDIASIELDTNPGAKYSATVSAVIHIKTVKKAGDGFSGSGRLRAKQGHYGSTSEQVSLNYRTNGLDIFGEVSHGFSHLYQEQRGNNQSQTSADYWQELQNMLIKSKYHTLSLTLGVNYQISDNHSVGVRYDTGKDAIGHSSNWPMTETVYKNGEQIEHTQYETEVNRTYPFSHLLNAYYNGKAGKLGIDFNTDYYQKTTRLNQDITETNVDRSQQFVNSHSNQRSEMWASKLVLTYPIATGKLEGGYEYTNTDRADDYTTSQQFMPSTDDHIKEQMVAGFLSYEWTVGKVEFGAGLRYEHVTSDYYSFGAIVPEQSRTYSRLFPNADITFPIGKAKFTLAYTEKTSRPSYWQLRSFVQYDSRYLYEAGNPLLRPAIRHDISLSGIYKWVYASFSYKRTKDYMTNLYSAYEEDSPINLLQYQNLDHLTSISAVLALSPKIGRWAPTWRVSLYQQNYEQQTLEGIRSFNTPLIQPRWENFVNLGKQFTLFASVNGRTAGDYENVHLKPSWQINLGISRQVGGWNLQLRANDLFRTARQSMITYGYSVTFDKWNYSDSQNVQFTATYRFNTTRSKYKGTGAGNDEKNRL